MKKTLAVLGTIGALMAGMATPANAHVSLCKQNSGALLQNWSQLSAGGWVHCGPDVHNTSTQVQVEIKKDRFGPDIVVARAVRKGHAPGYTTAVTGGPCKGRGTYYVRITHSLNGPHGPTYPVSRNYQRSVRC